MGDRHIERLQRRFVCGKRIRSNRGTRGLLAPRRYGGILTLALIDKICALVGAGTYIHVACAACGISQSSYNAWQDAKRYPGGLHAEFRARVREAHYQARARAEISILSLKPDTWLLKGPGRHQKEGPGWAQNTKIEVSGVDGAPLDVQTSNTDKTAQMPVTADLTKLNENELRQFRKILAKCLPGSDTGNDL